MLNQFPNSSCRSVFHKIIVSLRAERRRREARREKFTCENLTLPTIYLGPAGRRPAWAYDDYDDHDHVVDHDDGDDSHDGQEVEDSTTIMIIVISINIIIMIMINTRPKPAFGRLGLGRSSGGKTSGGVSTPRFAPSALSSTLKQYILAVLSQSSSS